MGVYDNGRTPDFCQGGARRRLRFTGRTFSARRRGRRCGRNRARSNDRERQSAHVLRFAFGSPLLLLLGNLSIYDEAIIWGFALSLGAIFFAFRSRKAEGSALTGALLGFSLCAGCALLSRVTFGAPFILIAPFLAL